MEENNKWAEEKVDKKKKPSDTLVTHKVKKVKVPKESKVKKAKEVETPKVTGIFKEKKIFITLDNSVNEVLSLNKQGKDLYFEDGPKFCRLGPAALKELSFDNTARYNLAFVSTEMDKEAKPTSKLNITPRFATATAKTDVKVLDPNIEPCWKRPEETRMAEVAGYAYAVEGKHVQTFAANDGENPKIGKAGDPELILMYITKEKHQAMIKAASDKSKRRDGAVISGAKSVLEQMGGKPFEDVHDDHKWGKIS